MTEYDKDNKDEFYVGNSNNPWKWQKKVIETIGDDTEAVQKYKTMVGNRHAPEGLGYIPVYLR